MPPDERDAFLKDVKKTIQESVKEELGSYRIPKEQHYLDHEWINDWREWQSTIKSSVIRSVVGLVITALAVLLLYGFVFLRGIKQ